MALRALRRQHGWSQAELAEVSDLSVRTIQRIENGSRPSLEAIKALATSFNLSAAELQIKLDLDRSETMTDPLSQPSAANSLIAPGFERLFWHAMVFAAIMCVIAFVTAQLDVTTRLGWGVGLIWAGALCIQLAWVLWRGERRSRENGTR